MKDTDRTAGAGHGNGVEKDALACCRECLFWYRCKLGRIDCELKER